MRVSLRGSITSVGFASGDRFVVGAWDRSPLGPFGDVMWAQASGRRLLLVPSERVADFITAVYDFDAVLVVELRVHRAGRQISVSAGPIALEAGGGRGWRIPGGALRPAWWHRLVEAPVARATMGVNVFGTSPSGVHEWYRADVYRRVTAATASVDGADLGLLRPIDPPCRFGFSEPPRRPSMVDVRPLLSDPSGRLDEAISRERAVADRATSARPSDHR